MEKKAKKSGEYVSNQIVKRYNMSNGVSFNNFYDVEFLEVPNMCSVEAFQHTLQP